jgi:hypothetical protein
MRGSITGIGNNIRANAPEGTPVRAYGLVAQGLKGTRAVRIVRVTCARARKNYDESANGEEAKHREKCGTSMRIIRIMSRIGNCMVRNGSSS